MDLSDGISILPVYRSRTEWRAMLPGNIFNIMRLGHTEPPFTGELWQNQTSGTYHCAGCGLAVFSSAHKFDSGTGWPSFFDIAAPRHVRNQMDTSHKELRVEVHCGRCHSHLGHVFPDGPHPSGLRYCLNALSLTFQPQAKSDAS
ncbi:MAG: peptide-methionine (R)-S-oxide reductase MsrB [Bacteroidota bacterium]